MTENPHSIRFENALRAINISLSALLFMLGMGLADSINFFVALCFAFFLVNAALAFFKHGVSYQVILFISTILFPLCFAWDFINAMYFNPDPQSGLVFLLGLGYSVLMFPVWLYILIFSPNRLRRLHHS